jgi:hypothetical protein
VSDQILAVGATGRIGTVEALIGAGAAATSVAVVPRRDERTLGLNTAVHANKETVAHE